MGIATDVDEAKLAASILIELFKEGLKGLKVFDRWVREETEKYNLLGRGIEVYGRRMIGRYNQMQIFGQAEAK